MRKTTTKIILGWVALCLVVFLFITPVKVQNGKTPSGKPVHSSTSTRKVVRYYTTIFNVQDSGDVDWMMLMSFWAAIGVGAGAAIRKLKG